jgi:hypothetical protein
VAERDTDAHDSVRVVPADAPGHDVTLFSAQPGTFACWGTAGEVRYRRAGHQNRVDRGEDAAFAQRTDDPPDMPGGKEFFGGFEKQNPAIQHVGANENRPAMKVSWITSTQPPQAWPVTVRAGPCQLHGPAGLRSPKKSRARTLGRRGADLARGRELDRDQAGDLGKPSHRLLVHRREGPSRGERRRQHGHLVSPAGLMRADQIMRYACHRTTPIAPAPE